jgi:TP901 family phage tail tape measure protein
MADVNANIGVNIDTSDALNQLKNLQRQISQFHQSVAKSSSAASIAQRDLQKNFVNGVNAIQGFSAELRTVRTSAESFTNSLEKNKFSIQQYFRYAASQTKTFGKNFTSEFATIEKTAIERVKTLQTQYIKMGRDANGAMQAIAIRPTVLNMKDLGTQTAIAAQKQVLFNQLIKQGSTNLLNFGKNTQWAGRQLMVGFTLPLATLGMTAGRVFMDMEKAAIKFKKVYGDLFTAPEETQKAMDSITELGLAYTKYGVAVSDSLSVAADAAAAGFQGVDLQNQTTASLKLSVLGQMELQKALETTIALQNAFRISSQDLVGEIDFLNAVENQTVVSLDDITEATPRVATVIQALGGDVRDLAFFLAAMKEGGVNAAQGANALKSGLASLINPTERASELLMGMGINIRGIVSQNQGDLRGTVVGFARALDTLDPMKRAQAIEQLFGKFQFARISALFDNVIREGSQASRVLDLAGSSLSELASLSDKELGVSAASSMNKFRASIEQLKVALAPVGEMFLKIATPFIDFATTVLKAFNNLPDGMKQIIGTIITVVGGLGPVLLMTFGLINNGIANMIKFFATVRLGYLKMTGQAKGIGDETQYMTQEQLEAAAAAASLDQAHAGLTQRFTAEKTAVDQLRAAYEAAAAAGARFALLNPGMMKPGSVAAPAKMAKGGVVSVGGRGNKDTQPALLTPGEAVIPAAMVKQYAPLIEGMIAGNIPGYAQGVMLGMPRSAKSVSKNRDAAEEIYQMFLKSSYAGTPPTEYGHQISPTSGHSFPIFGLGGVYQKGNKQVFVKPVLDEKAALAEMRSTEITRKAHGLEAPQQRIVVIRDPLDTTRTRRFLALESDLDPKFVNNQPMGLFNEDQYFRQLVASLLRVDKDLSGSNVFGNVVADAGPAGVFNRASGLREYDKNLPSMEDQALINLLGIKGGAKRAFAESTLGMMAGITPQQYHQRMLAEIQKVIPRLKETIASFKLTDPTEVGVYDDMVRRLEQGLGVDWSKFHAIHSAVKIPKPKGATQAAPQNLANGGMVRGPGGPKDDAIPANLSNGEAVIDAATVKKNPGIIAALFQKKRIAIPGYAESNGKEFYSFGPDKDLELGGRNPAEVRKVLDELRNVTKLIDGMDEVLYQALVRLGKALNPSNLAKALNEDPSLELLRSPVVGKGRKTGSQGAVKMHAGGSVVVENIEELRGVVSDATMRTLTENNATQVRLLQDMVFGGPAAANKGRLTGNEFAGALDSNEGKDAFMRYIAEAGNIPPDHPDLRRFAETVRQKLLRAGTAAIDDPAFGQIIQEALQEEIYAVGKNTTQAVKNAFDEAQKYSAISSNVRGPAGRDLKLLPNQNFSVGNQQVESIARTKNYTEMQTPVSDDILFDNATLGIVKERAIAAGHEVGRIFAITAGEAAIDAARANSPSKETVNASESLVDGVTTTIVNAKDEVAASVEEMISPITDAKGRLLRRSSSDPVEQAKFDEINAKATQATTDSANIAAGRFRGYRSASAPQGPAVPVDQAVVAQQAQEAITKASEAQLQNLQKMSMSISAVSFGLSSLTGVLSAFGVDLGGVMPVISGVTGALFALSMATSALTQATFARTISERVSGAGGIGALFTQLKGGATGLKGAGNIFARVAGAFKTMFPILSRLIIPLGIVATLFAGWEIYNKIQEEARRKIQGLGDVATLTSEKIDKLGGIFGVTPTQTALESAKPVISATGDVAADQRSMTQQVLDSEGFAEDYKNEIATISQAGKEDAELALKALAFKLSGKGFAKEQIDGIVSALVTEAGRTDVKIEMGSIDLNIQTNQDILNAQIEQQMNAISESYKTSYEKSYQENASWFDQLGKRFEETLVTPYLGEGALDRELKTRLATLGGVFQSLFIGLSGQLASGQIGVDQFNLKFEELSQKILNMPTPEALLLMESVVKNLTPEMQGLVNGLSAVADQMILIKAASAGVVITPEQTAAIVAGSEEGATDTEISAKNKALQEITRTTADYIKLINEGTKVSPDEALMVSTEELDAQSEKIRDQIFAYEALTDAGFNAAEAIRLMGNEALVASIKQNGMTAETIASARELLDLEAQLSAITSAASGSGQKSPFQEAIDSLKEQRQEIKNSISAYAGLRSAGLGVAEAAEIAKDSMLAAALASQKVGSAGWNQLVTAIRAARAEEEAWLNSTPEGRAEHFSEVYGKVMDVFNAQEAILEMNNEAATAANRKIIETLEKQIQAYERRASELQRDLDKIAEKEDEINKAYDEKTKALETVKKLNQDIINQQKSQLSIADALSQGDISAAAAAMQDARAQSASAQGDAMGTALDAARQSQLNALTENGKTRKEIEAEIKQIKKDISAIEFGALQTARDAVQAADEALETAKENLRVQGQSRDEWENINTRIDASKANAALYEAEVAKALLNAQGLVGEWSKLQDTFTTTHVVNTVYNGTPSAITPAATTNNSAAAAAALRKLQTSGASSLTNAERQLLGMTQIGAASGGYISGPGTATSDSIPAMLSDGEYVIKAAAVNKFGKGFLDAINAGRLPGFKMGGSIGGGSSKSTPAKPPVRMTADAAERRTLAAKPATKATAQPSLVQRIVDMAVKSVPLLQSAKEGIDITKSLINVGQGKATSADAMVLGLGALNFIPGGRGVSTGVKAVTQATKNTSALKNFINFKRNPSPQVLKDPVDIGTMEGYVANAGWTMLPSFVGNRMQIDNIIKSNSLGIPKGSNIVRVANQSDSEILSTLKPGQAMTLDRFMSVTTASSKEFIEGMAKGAIQTGGRAGGFGGAPYPMMRFNVKSDIPGIEDINKIIPNSASNVVDGLLARGQNMKLARITTNRQTGQKTYYFDIGQGIRAKTGFNQLGGRAYQEQLRQGLIREGRPDLIQPGTPGLGGMMNMSEWMPRYFAKGGLATNKFAMGGLVSPKYFAMGGLVSPKYFANGGMARGTDTVPSMLTPGEFVTNKASTKRFAPILEAINNGNYRYSTPSGSMVSKNLVTASIQYSRKSLCTCWRSYAIK